MPEDFDDVAQPGGPAHARAPLPPELDPRVDGRHRGRYSSTGHGWLAARLASKVLGALLAATLLLGFGYGWQKYHDLNSNLNVIPVVRATVPAGHKDIDGKDQNILIVGNDDRSNMTNAEVSQLKVGRDGGSLATDTMMIVHVPADGKAATLLSLPRDAYVAIPGYGMNKLNAAYALAYTATKGTSDQKRGAGASLLEQTVTNLTGLTLDNFVQVDLLGFVRISDAIGGVAVNLCHAVDDTYAHNQAEGQGGGSGLLLSAGPHKISGVTALEFVRQRHNLPNGDLDRVARQRYFLAAAFRKIASAGTLLNPSRLSSLITAIDQSLYVGPGFDVLKFAQQVAGLSADKIKGQTIPIVNPDGSEPIGGSDQSVEIIDPAQVQQFVRTMLGQDVLGSVPPAAPSTVTVQVVNGGAASGAARRNASVLAKLGFHSSYDSQATSQAATTIRFADGMQAAAKALAAHLPANVVLVKANVTTLTLVLGADGLSVKTPAPTTTSTAMTSPTVRPTKAPKPLDAGCIN